MCKISTMFKDYGILISLLMPSIESYGNKNMYIITTIFFKKIILH